MQLVHHTTGAQRYLSDWFIFIIKARFSRPILQPNSLDIVDPLCNQSLEVRDQVHWSSIRPELGIFFTFRTKVTLHSPGKRSNPAHGPWVHPFIIGNPGAGQQTGPFSHSPWNSPTVASGLSVRQTFGTLWYLEGNTLGRMPQKTCWAHPQVQRGIFNCSLTYSQTAHSVHTNCFMSFAPGLQKQSVSLGCFAALKEGRDSRGPGE